MKKIQLNKKIIKGTVFVVLLILLAIVYIIFRSDKKNYAKYSNYYDVQGFSQISKPIFQVDGNSNIKIDGKNDTIYDFSVKNYEENDISDVSLEYYIKFVNNSDADLQFLLTKNGKNVKLNNNETPKLILSNKNKQNDNYKLQIKYRNDPNQINDIQGNVQIKVEAVQAEI